MADIINYRDLILQRAAVRFEVPPDPPANIIPGYTGITLVRSPDMFSATQGIPSVKPDRMIFTAGLKGIPANVPITWKLGHFHDDQIGHGFVEEQTNIILTDTGDPFTKTVEASNYLDPNVWPGGYIMVVVTFGGVTFTALSAVIVFNG